MLSSSRTYGSSLYSLANEEGVSELIYNELKSVSDIISDNREYIKILDSAALSSDTKFSLIDESFKDKVHSYIVNFIKILTQKRLMHTFFDCCKIFENHYRNDNNIETVTVTTAVSLSEQEKGKLLSTLTAKFNKTFIPSFVVNPEIIGGMIINFENSHVDASLKTQLNEIKRAIS